MLEKEEFSLKYPQKFVINYCFRKCVADKAGFSKVLMVFYPTPCHVLEERKIYDKKGGVKQTARVFIKWEAEEVDSKNSIKERKITKDNYYKIIRDDVIEINKVFDTYEDCKIEAKKMNEDVCEEEHHDVVWSPGNITECISRARRVAAACKKLQDEVMSAADELYVKMTNNKTTKVCPAVEATKEILAEKRNANNNENPTSGGEGR